MYVCKAENFKAVPPPYDVTFNLVAMTMGKELPNDCNSLSSIFAYGSHNVKTTGIDLNLEKLIVS